MKTTRQNAHLFEAAPELPEGFLYPPELITAGEEAALLVEIRRLSFSDVRMHGVTARRRVVHFGWRYAFDRARLSEGPSLPPFLEPARDRTAALAGVAPEVFSEALVTEYPPGAAIGWHRDAPMFGIVAGISLLGACRFRLRQQPGSGDRKLALQLEPRSAYVLSGAARDGWQHSIPPVRTLRYSITFRTLRRRPTRVPR